MVKYRTVDCNHYISHSVCHKHQAGNDSNYLSLTLSLSLFVSLSLSLSLSLFIYLSIYLITNAIKLLLFGGCLGGALEVFFKFF